MNAILCAAQGDPFNMLMSSLALMAINDIDSVIAGLYLVMSGINLDEIVVTTLTRRDHHFSKGFAIPHLIWVTFYSLFIIGVIPNSHPDIVATIFCLV